MGMFLSKPDVYDEPVKTVYASHGCGSVCLAIFSWLCVLILPFVFGILMGGFWLKNGVFTDAPTVTFEGKAALRLTTQTGEEYLWASSEQLQNDLAGDPRFVKPFFSILSDDRDGNDRPDWLLLDLKVPLSSPDQIVTNMEFLPAFLYEFRDDSLRVEDEVFLRMEGAPFIQVSLPVGSGNAVMIDGRLQFDQYAALYSNDNVRYDRIYNKSHFPNIRDAYDLSNLHSVASKYAIRNESLVVDNRVVSFGNTDGDSYGSFSCQIRLRVASVTVNHVPSTAEVVKWGWLQYFSIAYVVYWFFYHTRRIFVKNGLVDTIAIFNANMRR